MYLLNFKEILPDYFPIKGSNSSSHQQYMRVHMLQSLLMSLFVFLYLMRKMAFPCFINLQFPDYLRIFLYVYWQYKFCSVNWQFISWAYGFFTSWVTRCGSLCLLDQISFCIFPGVALEMDIALLNARCSVTTRDRILLFPLSPMKQRHMTGRFPNVSFDMLGLSHNFAMRLPNPRASISQVFVWALHTVKQPAQALSLSLTYFTGPHLTTDSFLSLISVGENTQGTKLSALDTWEWCLTLRKANIVWMTPNCPPKIYKFVFKKFHSFAKKYAEEALCS